MYNSSLTARCVNVAAKPFIPQGTCDKCGAPVRFSHTKHCRACWMEIHRSRNKTKRFKCEACGVQITYGRTRCWDCHVRTKKRQKVVAAPACERCAGPVSTRKTKVCRACIRQAAAEAKAALTCERCGRPKSTAAVKLCMPCRISADHEAGASHVCSICGKKARAKNLCPTHHRSDQRRKQGVTRTRNAKLVIAKMPCAVCGYDRMNSRVHRYTPGSKGGKYVPGNMVPVCGRCHDEIHAGITTCPQPPALL